MSSMHNVETLRTKIKRSLDDRKDPPSEAKRSKRSKGKTSDNQPKSNADLRGIATRILLKGLPSKVKYAHFKKSLPVTPKNITLAKKSGHRRAVLTFASAADCSAAFDAFQTFIYEGHSLVPAFVRQRATAVKASIVKSKSVAFFLDITNIPLSTTIEELKEAFPKAVNILMRSRKDGKFKGY
uniref:RRM domain-containing protein n=1 Tax=Mesocestoides corti TaxID=53468 RepID=A0A5K3G0J6_MESCO